MYTLQKKDNKKPHHLPCELIDSNPKILGGHLITALGFPRILRFEDLLTTARGDSHRNQS